MDFFLCILGYYLLGGHGWKGLSSFKFLSLRLKKVDALIINLNKTTLNMKPEAKNFFNLKNFRCFFKFSGIFNKA